MAKKIKPRADVAEITSGFEELPIINSRPIDVFVAPSRVPTSEAVNSLINSLERFNPALQNYKAEEYKTFTVEEEANAERAFNKTKSDIKSAVKSGEIPAGASPEFVNKWVKLDLKKKARLFKTQLFEAYREQGILGNSDPEAFNIFFDKFSSEFKANNKLDGYDAVNVAEGFLPFTMTAYEQLNAQHITGRVAEIEKIAKEDLANETYSIGVDGRYGEEQTVNNYFLYNNKKIPEKDKRLIFTAENIFNEAQALIDAGLPAREANKIIRDTIKNLAINFEDEELLKIFQYIPTADGGTMAGTQAVQNLINDTTNEITRLRILRVNQEEQLKAYDDKLDSEAIIDGFTKFIDDRDGGIETLSPRELEDWFKAGIIRSDNKEVSIDAVKRGQIFTLYENYQKSLTMVGEDQGVINEFYERITKNPYDITLKKDLIDELGENINDTTYRTISNFITTSQAHAGDFRIKHPDFQQVVEDLDNILTDLSLGSTAKVNAVTGISRLKEKAYLYLEKNPSATKDQFDDYIQKEADKLLIKLLPPFTLDSVQKARLASGDTTSLISQLKKISEQYSQEDKVKIADIFIQQSELHDAFFYEKSISSEEYGEAMDKLNNQIMEIAKEYNAN